jgi:hypothetical protein
MSLEFPSNPIENTQETSADRAERFYQEKILPIIEILKPDAVSFEEYEEQVMDDLFGAVKKQEVGNGILIQDPEKTIEQAHTLLLQRIHSVLEDARDYNRKTLVDPELVKKSKIVLLTLGDLTDVEKYKTSDPIDSENISFFKNYIVGYGNDQKFSESDVDALMKTKYKKNLTDSDLYIYIDKNYGTCNTIPKSLMIGLAQSEKSSRCYPIEYGLESAEKGKYDDETLDILITNGYGDYALKFAEKFENCNPDKFVDIYFPTKYYNDILQSISRIPDEILKNELKEKAAKKSKLAEGDIKYLDEQYIETYHKICDYRLEGKMTSEKINDVRKLVEDGYLNIVDDEVSTIIKFLAENDYTFLLENAIKNEQEHFLITLNLLKEQDVLNYIQKCKEKNTPNKIIPVLPYLKNEQLDQTIFSCLPSHAIKPEFLSKFKNLDTKILLDLFSKIDKSFFYTSHNNSVREHAFSLTKKKFANEVSAEAKNARLDNINKSFYIFNDRETLPQEIQEILKDFESQYGKKGKHLVALAIATYGIENPALFNQKMRQVEKVLNKYNHENIPVDSKVSMGIEYEVTESIGLAYNEISPLSYQKDIEIISESSNIGKGYGGIYEIAPKPNYNPYMLMAEIKLLQDAEFFDFNFEKYSQAARGYHLSLVGDRGLKIDENIYFLNNVLTMTQLTGIIAGKEVESTKPICKKGFEPFSDSIQKGNRCEIKGMATDSVEQFEKAIITAHHAGIAIQLSDKYLWNSTQLFEVLPKSPEEFEKMLTREHLLLKPFETDQERDIVYEWVKLKELTKNAVEEHNESFIDAEFNGYVFTPEGDYIDTSEHITYENKKRLGEKNIDPKDFQNKVQLKVDDLFIDQQPEFVNALSKINNFFLFKNLVPGDEQYFYIKQPDGTEKAILNLSNAQSFFEKRDEGYIVRDDKYTKKDSIFDTNGEYRDGYYNVGSASEEMIIHKSQILLNHFNKNMLKLLETKGVKRYSKQEILETV